MIVTSWGVFADWNPDSSDTVDSDLYELNAQNMFIDDNSGLNSGTDLFENDPGSDMSVSSWNNVNLLNNLYPDFAAATDTLYDCLSLPQPPTRMHARADSCASPDTSQNAKVQQPPDITTSDQVEEYWCSAKDKIGFGNIPVCDRSQRAIVPLVRPSELELEADVIPPSSSPPLGFKNLGWCSLRRLIHETFGDRLFRPIEILMTTNGPLVSHPFERV